MIVVLQHFGIGDVIFCQTAIRNKYPGEKIYWPVLTGYVEGLNRAYPDIEFVDSAGHEAMLALKEFTVYKGFNVVPLRWSYEIIKVPFWQCMMSKYLLFNMDYEIWKDKAMWVRDTEREQELFNYLGLREGESFALVNTTFGSDFSGRVNIKIPRTKTVTMRTIAGFSLFDWAYVIQKASVIHTVSTSIIYLLEMLELTAKVIHIYIRRPHESNHRNYDYLLKKHRYYLHS